MSIAESSLAEFSALGYARGIRVADRPQAERYRRLFDEVEAREGKAKCQAGLFDPHFSLQFVWELATHPVILDCVEAIIGPNILLMASHFFCKYGPSEAFVAPHQDVTYWGLDPPLAVSAWYAVDDSSVENGCMQVIPGTHRSGIRAHGKSSAAGANLLSVNQEVSVSDEEIRRAVDLEVEAGQISLHDGLTIHGSPPNRSMRRRCGLAMIYLPTHIKQAGDNSLGTRWAAVLVRGQNRERNFADVPVPFPLA